MAFVRVKRRHDEDPYNSIIVSHKKLKSVCSDFSVDCVFQFAATIKDEVSVCRDNLLSCVSLLIQILKTLTAIFCFESYSIIKIKDVKYSCSK